jgi:hypothetical protein
MSTPFKYSQPQASPTRTLPPLSTSGSELRYSMPPRTSMQKTRLVSTDQRSKYAQRETVKYPRLVRSSSKFDNPSQRPVCQLPSATITDPYDHEQPSLFETVLDEVFKGFHASEGQFLQTKAVADLEASLQPQTINSDPVKRFPSTPYTPSSYQLQGPNISSKLKCSTSAISWETLSSDEVAITDKDVLKGLKVALAAVCDESTDELVENTTGRSVRGFLADLSLLEGLGFNELSDTARKTILKRRKELRRRPEQSALDDRRNDAEAVGEKPRGRDRNLGLVAADEGVDKSVKCTGRRELQKWTEKDGIGWRYDAKGHGGH